MTHKGLPGYGEEIPKLEFYKTVDWFIKFTSLQEQWRRQPTYLVSEYAYFVIALLTLIHSWRLGGCYKFLWLSSLLHGLVVECVSHWIPQLNIIWHSQATVMLLGHSLPLHILLHYPAFIYTASVAVSRLRLSKWAEPFAVGVMVVLMDVPYQMMGVKFVHWTWHDTDPNIWDRFYWVPWNILCFNATSAASFTFFFHFFRKVMSGMERHTSASFIRELLSSLLTALCAMPGGVLLLIPFCHLLHDVLGILTETCFFIIMANFCLFAWTADRNPVVGSRPRRLDGSRLNEIPLSLLLHYSVYLGMVIYSRPEEEVSIGLHQPTGPCDEVFPIHNILGMTIQRKKYLCTANYDEGYFNFQCLPGGTLPSDGMDWYTVCGMPFSNRKQYITVISTICWVAFIVFYNVLFCSGREVYSKPRKQKSL